MDEQEKLLKMLFEIKMTAKVGRIRGRPPEFYEDECLTTPIAFARINEGFALASHRRQIENREELSPLSPIYINLRGLPKEVYDQIGRALSKIKLPTQPDCCVGIPEAGLQIVEAFSKYSGIPRACEFLQKVQTNGKKEITLGGTLKAIGDITVLLVDDGATSADTAIAAAKAMEDGGFKAMGIATVFDREQGAREKLKSHGLELYTIFTISRILNSGLEEGRLSTEQYARTMDYLGPNKQFLRF